jgi:MFS family permease
LEADTCYIKALVGIAFATAFTFGPPLGAYFTSFDLSTISPTLVKYGVYEFSSPAVVALALLAIEVVYIMAFLPETSNLHKSKHRKEEGSQTTTEQASLVSRNLANLRTLNIIHALHLFIFSGMEFTLVFLTYDVFDYSNMQQGKLLGFIGIASSLIQGGYVRRKARTAGEKKMVLQGVIACTVALVMFALLAEKRSGVSMLFIGAFCFAITSGTVVSCLTSLASMQCQDYDPRLAKGHALGVFRSYGQLGRAIGPLVACTVYWAYGPVVCYSLGAICMSAVTVTVASCLPQTPKSHKMA